MQLASYQEWGEKFDQGMTIRRRVMEALGIKLPKQIREDTRETLKQAMIGCVTCDQMRSYASWLTLGDASAEPPAFCPNREVFLNLMKEKA